MSAADETRKHIAQVHLNLDSVVERLKVRADVHDASKLESPEVEAYELWTKKQADCTYYSDAYKAFLLTMKPILDHHYAANAHHPEHTARGISGMSLLDLIEMICDWQAATMRHDDGDIRTSIEVNQHRFKYSDELKAIFLNTANELGY